MPAISIIISSFNRLEYFKKSWPTIQPQLKPEDELVVVEDGSEDWSGWIHAQHPNVKYVATGHNNYRSCSKAKNIALKASSNPIIFINDPEVWHITPCIQQVKDRLATDPNLFIVPGSLYAGRFHGDTPQPEPTIKHSMAPFVGGVMRQHLIDVGGWDERFVYWGNDDNDLMHRLGLNNVQTYCDDSMAVFHQWHPRPPKEAMGDYNEGFLYEKNKSVVANVGKDWGVLNK